VIFTVPSYELRRQRMISRVFSGLRPSTTPRSAAERGGALEKAERWSFSVHEAGHLVAARQRGLVVRMVCIERQGSDLHGSTFVDWGDDPFDEAVVRLAGCEAEAALGASSGGWDDDDDDLARFRELAAGQRRDFSTRAAAYASGLFQRQGNLDIVRMFAENLAHQLELCGRAKEPVQALLKRDAIENLLEWPRSVDELVRHAAEQRTAVHEPFTGSHSHPHHPYQSGEDLHEHFHTHAGDASHDHDHDAAANAALGDESMDSPNADDESLAAWSSDFETRIRLARLRAGLPGRPTRADRIAEADVLRAGRIAQLRLRAGLPANPTPAELNQRSDSRLARLLARTSQRPMTTGRTRQ
jgi:hypothetical protein